MVDREVESRSVNASLTARDDPLERSQIVAHRLVVIRVVDQEIALVGHLETSAGATHYRGQHCADQWRGSSKSKDKKNVLVHRIVTDTCGDAPFVQIAGLSWRALSGSS